jgi:hypothetical protein
MNPLKPSATLLCKLGSIVVHTEEMLSDKGHHFDLEALKAVLTDREVEEWMLAMQKMALLPEKRTITRGQL